VLIDFLNAVLKPPQGEEIAGVELLDREIDPQFLLERGARLDILATTEKKTIINIEVQVTNQYNIDKRTIFYWARLYSGQLDSGQDFKDLRKTVTVTVLGFDWFPNKSRYHHIFHIREDETGQLLNDNLEMHFLELEKVKILNHRPQNKLEAWLMYLNNLEGEEMEAIAMENPGIKKAMTIEQIFWQSKKERRMYELREKALRDEISALAGAKAEGISEGIAEGKAEGIAEGKAEMAQESICKYLEVRFSTASLGLQQYVRGISSLDELNRIINSIYTAGTIEEAQVVVMGTKN
jgi:predicted transposase/invertase (TIGR01784 family)